MDKNYTNDENFNELIKRTKEINEMGYVKGVNNNLINSCGLTFESLLGKQSDSLFLPDFKDIEIKCKQRFSRYNIDLFTLAFDGPSLYESNYILENYGKTDEIFLDKKSLFVNLKYKEKVMVNNKYYFELDIDDKTKMLYINIYDENDNFIEKRGFISFFSIETRINIKLRKLALVRASKRKISYDLYFRYYKISCYTLKSFETFIDMIKQDVVKLSIVLRFSKSGAQVGKQRNKNMVFSIRQDDVEKIYDLIYNYEN